MTAVTDVRPGRAMGLLLVAILVLGIADSVTGSYIVLFGADRARLSPFEIGVFVSATALSGIVLSTWLGRRYDRVPSRVPALLAVAAPAAGYLILVTTTSYPLLLAIAIGLLGAEAAAFPQLFALARSYLAGTSSTAARRFPVLRSSWSVAWAIGPVLGAAVLNRWGFAGLFFVSAAAFALVALPVVSLGPSPASRAQGERQAGATAAQDTHDLRSRIPVFVVLSFALFHIAQFSGAVALPLYVTQVLGRPAGDVGLLFSVCALVEIPTVLGLMLLPERVRTERVLLVAMMSFVAYFVLVATSRNMPMLVLAQAARGVAIGIVGALGITYFQDLAPDKVGHATTMFANTATVGSLMAGLVAGSAAQAFGSRVALFVCGALSALALVLLAWAVPAAGRPRGRRRERAASEA
jgi:SET family sugar efflux transporter-like MFS transporter